MFDWETFEDLLKKHDWTYMYSDDSRYFNAGQLSSATIKMLLNQAPDQVKAHELFNKYKG